MSTPQGKGQTRILLEQETEKFALKVEVTADEMTCRVSVAPRDISPGLTPDDVLRCLKRAGITEGIDTQAVMTLCRKAGEGRPQDNVVVACGTEPEPGPDGSIEFFVRVSSSEILLEEDEEGTVDLRTLNFFGNVEPGEAVGRVHPPENGPAGTTVTGLPVPPVPGKKLAVVAGKGVHLEEEGTLIVADLPGRVIREGAAVSVSEEYSVNGDVDFNVGNIDFSGFVEISGDVLDDFNVIGEKGINIAGTAGACRIESAGNIALGSMSGKGRGFIRCGGNLVVRYLLDARVECAGNVIVTSEIRNSTVKAAGSILVENGAISGGECVCLSGMEVKDLGSTLGVRTKVTAGVYFPEADRLETLHNRLNSLHDQMHRIQSALGPLLNRQAAGQSLPEAVLARVEILSSRMKDLAGEKVDMNAELAQFRHQEHPTANPKINVRDWLGECVTIQLGAVTEEIRLDMQGPLSIIENTRQGGLHFLDMTPLTLKAAAMEAELEDEEEPVRPEKKGVKT